MTFILLFISLCNAQNLGKYICSSINQLRLVDNLTELVFSSTMTYGATVHYNNLKNGGFDMSKFDLFYEKNDTMCDLNSWFEDSSHNIGPCCTSNCTFNNLQNLTSDWFVPYSGKITEIHVVDNGFESVTPFEMILYSEFGLGSFSLSENAIMNPNLTICGAFIDHFVTDQIVFGENLTSHVSFVWLGEDIDNAIQFQPPTTTTMATTTTGTQASTTTTTGTQASTTTTTTGTQASTTDTQRDILPCVCSGSKSLINIILISCLFFIIVQDDK